jgi:hypothetical protein
MNSGEPHSVYWERLRGLERGWESREALGFLCGALHGFIGGGEVPVDTSLPVTVGILRRRKNSYWARITSQNITAHSEGIETKTRLTSSVYWRSRRSTSTWSVRPGGVHAEEFCITILYHNLLLFIDIFHI